MVDQTGLFIAHPNKDNILAVNITTLSGMEEISKSIGNLHEVTANLRDMTADLKLHPWRLVRKG